MTITTKEKSKAKAKKTYVKKDIYQSVTDRIIEALEKGTAPWVKPWAKGETAVTSEMPVNAISGKGYQGVNTVLLWEAQFSNNYASNTWLTFKQAGDLGGTVTKGEKATKIIYFQMILDKSKENLARPKDKQRMIPMLKEYAVFNAVQCEGINSDKIKMLEPLDIEYTDALTFAMNTGADVKHGGDKAFCRRGGNGMIQMPYQQQFNSLVEYDGTLLHELTHWSGHEPRLNREFGARFGDNAYAFEELIAELGSAFLCSKLGLPLEGLQHDSYLAGWLSVLKADKKAIFKAAKLATMASDFLLASQVHATQAKAA